MYELLKNLCGNDNSGRGNIILDKIQKLGIDVEVQCFESRGKNYRNIISRLKNGFSNNQIAVSAHYDKVNVGEGAIDNGSAVVEIIGILEELVKNPKNIDLRCIFFDGEEERCAGSKYFVANNEIIFDGIYNLEVTGFGDSIIIGKGSYDSEADIYLPNDNQLNKQIQRLCGKESIPYYLVNTPGSDNVSCNQKGIPATVITTLPQMLGKKWEAEKTMNAVSNLPIHSLDDTLDKVDPNTLTMMKNFLLKLVNNYIK